MRAAETYRTGVAIFVTLGGLVAGGSLMQRAASAQETDSFDRAQLRRVTQIVSRRYVEEIPADRVYRMAIDGMLEELGDPHTAFMPAEDYENLRIQTQGEYGGIGISIAKRAGWITVITPLPGTPGERAGLRAGDQIVARVAGEEHDRAPGGAGHGGGRRHAVTVRQPRREDGDVGPRLVDQRQRVGAAQDLADHIPARRHHRRTHIRPRRPMIVHDHHPPPRPRHHFRHTTPPRQTGCHSSRTRNQPLRFSTSI
jgi:hypothetical protein